MAESSSASDSGGGDWLGPIGTWVNTLFGGQMTQGFNQTEAAKSREWQERMFRTRYQMQKADLEAAGLNPMLAYTQGPGGAPSGATASYSNNDASAAMQNAMQYRMNTAQVANVEADTENKKAQADLIAAQAAQANASAAQANANVGLINHNVEKIKSEIPKINQETSNLQEQAVVIHRTASMLLEQSRLMHEQGLTQAETRNQLQAIIRKLATETALNQYDIDAIEKFDNFGKDFKQLAPFLDMLKSIRAMSRPSR